MVLISAIMLFSYGLEELVDKSKEKNNLLFVVFALVFFEFFSVPYVTTYAVIPEQIYKISSESGNFTIINVPFNDHNALAMYFQTAHNKKLVDGYVSRFSPEILIHVNDIRKGNVFNNKMILDEYGIKYAIFHKNLMKYMKFQINATVFVKIYDDENIGLYKVR